MSAEALRFLQDAKKEENVEDIYLDDIEIKRLDGALLSELESMKDIICLSMNGCKLETLESFPHLPKLVRLELIENEFDGKDLVHLGHLSELQSLSLGCNNITDYPQLETLRKLENLIQLDLSDCPLSTKEEYRKNMFTLFPSLKILDNKDQEGNEFEYSESEMEDDDDNVDLDDDEEDVDEDDSNDEGDEEAAGGEYEDVDEDSYEDDDEVNSGYSDEDKPQKKFKN